MTGPVIFALCLFIGILADNVALGIIAGLVLGGAATARKKRDHPQG